MKQVTEEECWFVIGAHQAGASERQCAELSGISKTLVHNIIQNFKKLGSPHASNLSMNTFLNNQNNRVTKRKADQHNKNIPRKRGRPRKLVDEPFFTQSLLSCALHQARKQKKKSTSSSFQYIRERPDTPPTDDDQLQTDSLKISSPHESAMDQLPMSPHSNLTLDESDEELEVDWSLEDDKELLTHALGLPVKHIKWKQVEHDFQDRHLAKMCADRWEYLKKQLLKDIRNIDDNLVL